MSVRSAYTSAQIATALAMIGVAIPVKAAYVGALELRNRVTPDARRQRIERELALELAR